MSTIVLNTAPVPRDPGHVNCIHFRFSLWQRLFGEIRDRSGRRLGFLCRLTYESIWTDHPYYGELDNYWTYVGR